MKRSILLLGMCLALTKGLNAQELYVSTEPASNMPRNSLGIRLTTEIMPGSDLGLRISPEIMFGISKDLMGHSMLYFSDIHQKVQKFEGFGLYAKYRFFSIDSIQRHFRMSVYGRYSSIKNPTYTFKGVSNPLSMPPRVIDEINLEGDNSGIQGGIVASQLLHKLALSASVNYNQAFNNRGGYNLLPGQDTKAIGYTFSAGYLTFPKTYTSYAQPNLNVYLEFLGKTNVGSGRNFLEAAPAIQLILNSRTRIDVSKRLQMYGNLNRMNKNMFLVRLEHNLFNVF